MYRNAGSGSLCSFPQARIVKKSFKKKNSDLRQKLFTSRFRSKPEYGFQSHIERTVELFLGLLGLGNQGRIQGWRGKGWKLLPCVEGTEGTGETKTTGTDEK